MPRIRVAPSSSRPSPQAVRPGCTGRISPAQAGWRRPAPQAGRRGMPVQAGRQAPAPEAGRRIPPATASGTTRREQRRVLVLA
jgi:hypothetical protein